MQKNTNNKKRINVLSLFDGISCAMVALDRANLKVNKFFASEIDKYAIQVSQKNYPNIMQIGDVKNVVQNWLTALATEPIDLLIGGSPCQDLSIAKKDRKGLDGERSGLFWQYVKIRDEVKPKYFILENVASMSKEARENISNALGVQPVMINASLVSAQNRKRLFWVGKLVGNKYVQVEIPQPEDKGILLKDILENNVDNKYYVQGHAVERLLNNGHGFRSKINPEKASTLFATMHKVSRGMDLIRIGSLNSGGQGDRIYSPDGKSVALSALGGGRGAKTGLYHIPHGFVKEKITQEEKYPTLCGQSPRSKHLLYPQIRKLTPIECERLQGLPDNYTDGVSDTQRYKALGNAFNVDVVAHILKYIL